MTLSCTSVVVRHGARTVLAGVDVSLRPGELVLLAGRNGAGKSTLLRVLLGVLRPRRGTVRMFGLDPLLAHREVLQRTGYVPDVPDVPPFFTPTQLFAFLRPHYPTWDDARCNELAEKLRVPMQTKFKALSRGQGMKAMLTAALAPDPELLLLDEPFAGLDPLVREDVLEAVVGALEDGKRTVLCATHELELAARIADRVAVMRDGRIAVHDDLATVLGTSGEAVEIPRGLHRVLSELQEVSS